MISTLLSTLLICSTPAAGETVVILGDSLVEQGPYVVMLKTTDELWHPEMKRVWKAMGYGGHTIASILPHAVDVLAVHPDVVFIELGTNGLPTSWTPAAKTTFEHDIGALVTALRAGPAPPHFIAFMSAHPVEPATWGLASSPAHNALIQQETDIARAWCLNNNVTYVDPMPLLDIYTKTASRAKLWTADGIHPTYIGGLAMGNLILNGLGIYPPIMMGVRVTNLLDFDQLDSYTPFLMPAVNRSRTIGDATLLRDGVRYLDVFNAENKYLFQDTGLPSGTYDVRMDGYLMGTWTDVQLSAGVNLSLLPVNQVFNNPWTIQANKVFGRYPYPSTTAPEGENELTYAEAWRSHQLFGWPTIDNADMFAADMVDLDKVGGARDIFAGSFDGKLDAYRHGIFDRAQPVSHHFSVRAH